jgi:hypothetical protein
MKQGCHALGRKQLRKRIPDEQPPDAPEYNFAKNYLEGSAGLI